MKNLFRHVILITLSVLLMFSAGYGSFAEEAVFGDTDGDGEVTAQDASCISRHLNRFRMLDAAALTRADFDGDGILTENDASMILSSFMSTEFAVPVKQSFSMLLTTELNGYAWDPADTDEVSACTAIHTATRILELREEDPDLLLFDVGGSIFGSSISDDYAAYVNRSYGPITSLFIQLGYDAVLLGDEAFSHASHSVRREVNAMQNRRIPVLGANFEKSEPTVFDPSGVLWDELTPYVIFEVPQEVTEEPLRVAVIGMTDPTLSVTEDEISPSDPIEVYAKLRKELRGRADYTILLYHGATEVDAQGAETYSLRDLLKKTDSIDLVVASHSGASSVRSEKNADGAEVPIVSIAGGPETITKISVSTREQGRAAILVEEIGASDAEPTKEIRESIRPYTSRFSDIMDKKVTKLNEPMESFDPFAMCTTDAMELTHEMQLYAAGNWIDYNDVDLPNDLISIAYPYIPIGDLKEGVISYRDLYFLEPDTPEYTIMLIRGGELRAWLSDYAKTVMEQDTVYSLYGLSYLLNTMNPDAPLGFLEHSSGLSVDDDETFTLILAERTKDELNLRQYMNEEWMPYEDRIIEGFTLPKPLYITTMGGNPVVDALVAYLENETVFKLQHIYSWIII